MRATLYILAVVILVASFAAGYYLNKDKENKLDEIYTPIELPAPSRSLKVVSLAPSVTEIIAALGASDNLVGITNFCDYPPEITDKEKIGSLISPSIERIISLKPDVVIATQTGGNRLESAVSLSKVGIPMLGIRDNSLSELLEGYRAVGKLLDREAEAEKLGEKIVKLIDPDYIHDSAIGGKTGIFIVARSPLFIAGKNTLYDDVLRSLGVINQFGKSGYQELSVEAFLAAKCEIIFDCSGGESNWWNENYPVKLNESKIIHLDQDSFSRPGPRMVDSIIKLRSELPGMLK